MIVQHTFRAVYMGAEQSAPASKIPPVAKRPSVQTKLQEGVASRQRECSMITLKIKTADERMQACLAQKDYTEAKRWHSDIFGYKEHLNAVHASLRALEKQLVKLGLASLHKDTMQLMKDSAKHMYTVSSGAVTAENAIRYTDALADAHADVEEVGSILAHEENAGNSAVDDDWATIMQQHSVDDSSSIITPAKVFASVASEARGSPGHERITVGLPTVPATQPPPAALHADASVDQVSCVL